MRKSAYDGTGCCLRLDPEHARLIDFMGTCRCGDNRLPFFRTKAKYFQRKEWEESMSKSSNTEAEMVGGDKASEGGTRKTNSTLQAFAGSLVFVCLSLWPVRLLSHPLAPADTSCKKMASWKEVFLENGIKGVSLSVSFTWDHGIMSIHLEKIRYFSDYNQTNSTEIRREGKVITLEPSIEGEVYRYALGRMKEILEKEAQATGRDHLYGSFTYPVYDDPCRTAVYFSPKFTDPDETELMREAEAHNVARVQDLLKDTGVANLRDQYGRTALIHATIRSQSSSTVAALLASGSDPNISDSHGDTALINASQLGEMDTIQLLLSHGADIDARNAAGETALMKASTGGRYGVAMVHLLINSGASLNEQDKQGKTALMFAAREGSLEIVQDLLQAGADAKTLDKRGKNAIDYARRSGAERAEQDRVIRLLQDHTRQ